MNWFVGPWIWDAASLGGMWRPPAGCSGLDLRPLPLQSVRGGTPGMGLFFGDVPRASLENKTDYRLIGRGSWHDLKPTGVDRDSIPRRGGYTPKGDDLVGVVLDLLTDGADPDGLNGPKPLMPTTDGRLELHCGQRHSERFKFGRDRHTAMVRQSLRKEFAALFADAKAGRLRDAEHHRRVLDFWCEKYGIDDWREFVPVALQAEVPGRLKHDTTYTDDFNRTDAGTLGASWSSSVLGGTFLINTNRAGCPTGSTYNLARYNSDLSSSDNYAQCTVTDIGVAGNLNIYGAASRFGSSDATCYVCGARRDDNTINTYKFVAGTITTITSTGITLSIPEVYKSESNGSTIKSYQAGVERLSSSDTSITSGVRGGLFGVPLAGSPVYGDNWEAADIGGGGGGGGIVYTQLERGLRGYLRGVYEGHP